MENQARHTSKYTSCDIPVSNMLKQLDVSSNDTKYWHSPRQSKTDCKFNQPSNFNIKSTKNIAELQAINVPSCRKTEFNEPSDKSKLGSYEQSSESYSMPSLYSDLTQFTSTCNESSTKICKSISKHNDIDTAKNFCFRKNLSEETKSKDEKFIINDRVQPSLPSLSQTLELLEAPPNIYISPSYSDSNSLTHEDYFEKTEKPLYYSDSPIYSNQGNICNISNFQQQRNHESSTFHYLYTHSIPQRPYFEISPSFEKATNDMNGYIYNLETSTKKELVNESEDFEYTTTSQFLSIPSLCCKKTVEILGPEEVRWFYKTEGDKKWTAFIGYDSIKIEWAYREFVHKSITVDRKGTTSELGCDFINDSEIPQKEKPVVCGGLYEVDVSSLKGFSIYWKGKSVFKI